MKVIGLCGGSGSGKGTVSGMFLHYGIPSIDTDALYHDLTSRNSSCVEALRCEFGDGVLNSDGSLNRKALANIVFFGNDCSSKRDALNRISHKFVLEEVRRIISEYRKEGALAVLIDAPLLFESGFDKECDSVIAVIADKETRISRIVSRDGISRESALRRIESQMSDEYLTERAHYTINNSGTFSDAQNAVAKIAEDLTVSQKGEKKCQK